MKKLSDEELVGYTFQYCIPFGDGSLGNPRADLLSRLAKGRKAINAMEMFRKAFEHGRLIYPLSYLERLSIDYDKE